MPRCCNDLLFYDLFDNFILFCYYVIYKEYFGSMKKMSALLFLAGLISLTACFDDDESCCEVYTKDPQQVMQDSSLALIDSILKRTTATIRLDDNFTGLNHTYIGDKFINEPSRMVDTTEINTIYRRIHISIPFRDTSRCNYSNTKFFIDDTPLVASTKDSAYYESGFVARDFLPSYDEPHSIVIQYDSLNCGNLREVHVLMPSACPGSTARPEVGFSPNEEDYNDFDMVYASGSLFARVFPNYYSPSSTVYPDTVNSKCFLKNPLDSIKLKMVFEEVDNDRPEYPGAFMSIDSATLVNFMQNENEAILSCALVYQTWIVPGRVSSLTYYSKKVGFVDVAKQTVLNVSWRKDRLVIAATSGVERVLVKTSIDGKESFRGVNRSYLDSNDFVYSSFYVDRIYDMPEQSSKADSVQVIAVFDNDVFVSYDEFMLRRKIRKCKGNSTEDSLAFTQMLDTIVDANGSLIPNFKNIDAVRIPGYEKETE